MDIKSLSDPHLAKQINAGKIGVIPSDTVYGVVAKASDQAAVKRMYDLKKRENKPGTVIAASIDQLEELGIKRRYLTAVEQYWPNPISIVIPSGFDLGYLDQGKMSLAVRIPDNENLVKLLKKTGPLVTSSANTPGEPPAETIAEAKKYFGDQVDFYVDGGQISSKHSSTVIRIVDDAIEVLREGEFKIDENGRITK